MLFYSFTSFSYCLDFSLTLLHFRGCREKTTRSAPWLTPGEMLDDKALSLLELHQAISEENVKPLFPHVMSGRRGQSRRCELMAFQ